MSIQISEGDLGRIIESSSELLDFGYFEKEKCRFEIEEELEQQKSS